jgi:hypothetical protein
MVTATGAAVHTDLRLTQGIRDKLPKELDWVDAAAKGRPVTAIATPLSSAGLLLLQLYGNPSIDRELILDDAQRTDPYATEPVAVGSGGLLRDVSGAFLFDGSGTWASFRNSRLVTDKDHFQLRETLGAAHPSFRALIEGIFPDQWLIPGGRIRAWPTKPGAGARIAFDLSLPDPWPHPVRMTVGGHRFVLRPGETKRVLCASTRGQVDVEYRSRDGEVDSLLRPITLRLRGVHVTDVPATGGAKPTVSCGPG